MTLSKCKFMLNPPLGLQSLKLPQTKFVFSKTKHEIIMNGKEMLRSHILFSHITGENSAMAMICNVVLSIVLHSLTTRCTCLHFINNARALRNSVKSTAFLKNNV